MSEPERGYRPAVLLNDGATGQSWTVLGNQ